MTNNKEITLAEFLGWEEGKEYRCCGDIYRIDNDAFQILGFDGKWKYTYMDMLSYKMLRNAEKLHKPTKQESLYYAKIKGWGLVKNSRFIYWSADREGENIFLNDKNIFRNCRVASTKSEWAQLGINDGNADFERVEE